MGINGFYIILLRMIAASIAGQGITLQNIETEIIDAYQEGHINRQKYEALHSVCFILINHWRKQWKGDSHE